MSTKVKIEDIKGINPARADQKLASSIAQEGLWFPVILTPKGEDGKHQIIEGGNRIPSVMLLGWDEIDAEIKNLSDRDMSIAGLMSNVPRNQSPIAEARSFRDLQENHGMTQKDIATAITKSQPYVSGRLDLLDLPSVLQDKMDNREINLYQARAILRLSKEEQDEVATWGKITTASLKEYLRKSQARALGIDDLPSIPQNNSLATVSLELAEDELKELNQNGGVAVTNSHGNFWIYKS